MLRTYRQGWNLGLMACAAISLAGCATSLWGNRSGSSADCSDGYCNVENVSGNVEGACPSCGNNTSKKWWKRNKNQCDTCENGSGRKWGRKSKGCKSCNGGGCNSCGGGCCGLGCCGLCCANRSLAIQDEYPLGAVMRATIHQMETNGEAADFILFQKDFVGASAELTPDGKDKVLEIAARMRSAPFPVLIERTWNNADPELDAWRRNIVAEILTDLGNGDANTRVIVSPAYGPGKQAMEGQIEYWMNTYQGLGYGGYGMGMGGMGMGGMGMGGMGGGFGGGGMGGGFF